MDNFTDYYALLGINVTASTGAIKAAFKKLALQYHPDVYKGPDADERMRIILRAYQTLNDPVARKQYDMQRSERIHDGHGISSTSKQDTFTRSTTTSTRANVSSRARRDRQRHYDFPNFLPGQAVRVDLVDMRYKLSVSEAGALMQQGMLRGVAPETEDHAYYCHRCHHHWQSATSRSRNDGGDLPRVCPHCRAADWAEYLLLRCIHCRAVFESEQIRYEVGSYSYGKDRSSPEAELCPPYELFPLCPYCGTAHWSPAEDARVDKLRQRLARRAATWRFLVISVLMVVIVVVGVVALGVLR